MNGSKALRSETLFVFTCPKCGTKLNTIEEKLTYLGEYDYEHMFAFSCPICKEKMKINGADITMYNIGIDAGNG